MTGKQVPFEDTFLETMTNWATVRKYYKLGGACGSGQGKGNETAPIENGHGMKEEEKQELQIQILGAMALRGTS